MYELHQAMTLNLHHGVTYPHPGISLNNFTYVPCIGVNAIRKAVALWGYSKMQINRSRATIG